MIINSIFLFLFYGLVFMGGFNMGVKVAEIKYKIPKNKRL